MSTTIRPTSAPAPHAPTTLQRSQADRERSLRRRLRSADTLVTASWLSVALAIALYLAAGGPAQITDLAGALTATGIVAGLVGTDLILVMLVLAARLPVIDAMDACAAAWSARRLADGVAECVGDGSVDARGRPMRICW